MIRKSPEDGDRRECEVIYNKGNQKRRKLCRHYGPIDFIALQFKGNKFKGDGLKALNDLMEKKIVRVIDLVIIVKDKTGKVTVKEIQEPDPDFVAIFDPTKVKGTHGMIKKDDIDMIAGEARE